MLKILKIQTMTFKKLTQEIKKKIPKLTFCRKTLEKKKTPLQEQKRKRKCYLISLFETITKHDLI